jgi:hypothetical protein
MLKNGARELIVVDEKGAIVGFLDEAEITQIYHATTVAAGNGGGMPKSKR